VLFPFHHSYHMPLPSHSPWFIHPRNIWCEVQIVKRAVIENFSLYCSYFLSLRPKYLFDAILSNISSRVSALIGETKSHTHAKYEEKLRLSVFYFLCFWLGCGKTKYLGPNESKYSLDLMCCWFTLACSCSLLVSFTSIWTFVTFSHDLFRVCLSVVILSCIKEYALSFLSTCF
jgi:hypothetical protein